MTFPPEPWRLRGELLLSMWRLPRALLPQPPGGLPPGIRPWLVGGSGLVGVAWVDYQPGGTLEYRELLAAVLTRHRGRPVATISHIWVDSETSRDGGRALWGIPKDLAALIFTPGHFTATDLTPNSAADLASTDLAADGSAAADLTSATPAGDLTPAGRAGTGGNADSSAVGGGVVGGGVVGGGAVGGSAANGIASAAVTLGVRLPGRWPVRFRVAQTLGGRPIVSPIRVTAGIRRASAQWTMAQSGPLGFLAGRPPILTLALTNFHMLFGRPRSRP